MSVLGECATVNLRQEADGLNEQALLIALLLGLYHSMAIQPYNLWSANLLKYSTHHRAPITAVHSITDQRVCILLQQPSFIHASHRKSALWAFAGSVQTQQLVPKDILFSPQADVLAALSPSGQYVASTAGADRVPFGSPDKRCAARGTTPPGTPCGYANLAPGVQTSASIPSCCRRP